MQSAGGASENQLLFRMVPRNKTMSATPGELRKHAELIARFIPSRWLGFAGLACIPLVGWLDHRTGPAISFGLFYVPPVAMAAWFGGRRVGLIAAFASAAAWFTAGIPESAEFSAPLIYSWNATTRLLIFSLVALLVAALRQQRDQLQIIIEQKNARLELEMAERDLAEREIIEAAAREQRRIAYDLHDDLGQHLVGIAFKAKLLAEKLRSTHPAQAEEASTIARLANEAARQTRLTTHKLDAANGAIDLITALPQLAAAVEENCRVRVSVNTSACSVPMSAQVALQLYRIAQEAMRNAIEHGRADKVEIYLVSHREQIVLTVSDNGHGFDPCVAGHGLGFRTMGSRAHSVGGSCEVESRARGTVLICRVPIGSQTG